MWGEHYIVNNAHFWAVKCSCCFLGSFFIFTMKKTLCTFNTYPVRFAALPCTDLLKMLFIAVSVWYMYFVVRLIHTSFNRKYSFPHKARVAVNVVLIVELPFSHIHVMERILSAGRHSTASYIWCTMCYMNNIPRFYGNVRVSAM